MLISHWILNVENFYKDSKRFKHSLMKSVENWLYKIANDYNKKRRSLFQEVNKTIKELSKVGEATCVICE